MLKHKSLEEIIALPKEEAFTLMNLKLNEATMHAMARQSSFKAQREFNELERNKTVPDWCQVVLKRAKSENEELWFMFTPGDENAKFHPSYTYFYHALESGSTVLASRISMGWNCLQSDDEIMHMIYSHDRTLSRQEILVRGKKLQKYGI